MIKIIDNWYLDSDDNSFIVKRDTMKLDKQNNHVFTDYSYHATLESALKNIVRKCQYKEVQNDIDLQEFLERCQEINLKINATLSFVKSLEEIDNV